MLCLKYHKYVKGLVRPSHIYYSQAAYNRRRPHVFEEQRALIRETLEQNQQPTKTEWRELQHKLATMKSSSSFNVDAMIVHSCSPNELSAAKSYIKLVKEDYGQEPSTGALRGLLNLYYQASQTGTEITVDDQREIGSMLVF